MKLRSGTLLPDRVASRAGSSVPRPE